MPGQNRYSVTEYHVTTGGVGAADFAVEMTDMTTAYSAAVFTGEQASRFTGYPVTLPAFEGPLDLLLYLIRRQELDIYDIPIAVITGQFLDYLALMEAFDVEVAADFLVMAATLMEIKSRMLLPRPPTELLPEDEEQEDPRAELVRRLLEYQQYKSAAGELHRRADEQKRVFLRSAVVQELSFLKPDPALAGDTDAFSLWAALQQVLARIEAAGPVMREVVRPKVTIRQQMLYILQMLETHPQGVTFAVLLLGDGLELPTRLEVIVTFLALLELMRLHRIEVAQSALFGEIVVRALHAPAPAVN